MTKEIRGDRYRDEENRLEEILDAIPFTATQRRNIDMQLDALRILFHEANK